MITVTVNSKEFIQQVAKAKSFAGTSHKDNVHQKQNIEVHTDADSFKLVASSKGHAYEGTHVVAEYPVSVVSTDATEPARVTVFLKHLVEYTKTLPKTGEVTLNVTNKSFAIGGVPQTVRMFPIQNVREIISRGTDAKPWVTLTKTQVAIVKRNVVNVTHQKADRPMLTYIRIKDGVVEATDSYAAVRYNLEGVEAEGEGLISGLAFRHVKLSQPMTVSKGDSVVVTETPVVKVYTDINENQNYPNIEYLVTSTRDTITDPKEKSTSITFKIEELVATLKVIKKAHGKDALLATVQRGDKLYLVHVDPGKTHIADDIASTYYGYVGCSAGDSHRTSLWNTEVLLKTFKNQKGDITVDLPEEDLKAAMVSIGDFELLVMRMRDYGNYKALAEDTVDTDNILSHQGSV